MSTRVNGRYGQHPDSTTDIRCNWPTCTTLISRRFYDARLPFCQEHALHVWATVQDMMQSDAPPQPKPAARERNFEGFVYYIRIGDRIKIGHTTNIDRRLRSYPPGMKVLLLRRGSRKLEAQEHRRFSEYRTDGREWFAADDRLMQAVAETKAGLDPLKDTIDWEPRDFERRKHQPQVITHRKLNG